MKKNEMKENQLQELEEAIKKNSAKSPKSTQKESYDEELDEMLNKFLFDFDDDEDEDIENTDEDDLEDDIEEEEEEEEEMNDSEKRNYKDWDDEEEGSEGPTLEETLSFLDDMVGMEHVKEKLLRLGRYAQWKRKLEAVGIDTSIYPRPNLTFMFLGDPGTGKTTVARHMGEILHSIGLLSHDDVQEYRREDLIGECYGSEEGKTKEALRESRGKVFFLDEAYQCFKQSTDKHDPGYHILETMMAHFGRPNTCIIMAGYKNEMLELFKVNPGFRSRIPDENIIEFTGPSEQLLMDVANNAFTKMQFFMSPEAHDLLEHHIHALWTNKDDDFGNARVIRQFADSVVINHANRIMTTTMSDDFIITEPDVKQSIPQKQNKKITRSRIGFV